MLPACVCPPLPAGIPVPESEERWGLALEALKGVWASQYNERAYYSMRKYDMDLGAIRMAVLVQRVVQPQYAFVIHTKNPSNNNEREVFAELVKGLGETLVSGMVAGSSVAFKADKGSLDEPEVLCYASKSEGMYVRDSLIFRSDSNGEDLEGYAGAGLFDSITMDTPEMKKVGARACPCSVRDCVCFPCCCCVSVCGTPSCCARRHLLV